MNQLKRHSYKKKRKKKFKHLKNTGQLAHYYKQKAGKIISKTIKPEPIEPVVEKNEPKQGWLDKIKLFFTNLAKNIKGRIGK
jgi:hypothetical protein